MKVLKSRFLRVFFIMVLILSFFVSSAFASTVSLPYAEPPTGSGQGYVSIYTSRGNVYTYWWNTNLYGSSSNEVIGSANVNINVTSTNITFNFSPLGAGTSMYYNLSCTNGSLVWLLGSSSTSSNWTKTDQWGETIVSVCYGGNVGLVSLDSSLTYLSVSWGEDLDLYSRVNTIIDLLGSISTEVELSAYRLNLLYNIFKSYPDDIADIIDFLLSIDTDTSTIIDILEEWGGTSLDESTDPLPNQGINDFESTQGSLRNDSDVSSSLDNVFNSVDFGGFSNGFTAVWGLVDGVLNSHPIFFTLVILVLSLGLLNLIFNRR